MTANTMELINVNKRIGNKHIIKNLSFSIKQGEVFGFIGPNGAGKTTTIRMMVGLMGITSGDVLIDNKSIKSDYKNAVRHIGAIVENPELYPFMTGMQNLKHFARMVDGVTPERIEEVIKLVRLEKAINEKVRRYSLGMRQRLGIAQALLHRPKILILDEPTNGLDPSGMREIREYIRRIATEDNVSIIISSHLLSEIELMCDRIGVIKNGQLIAIQDVHADDEDVASSSTEKKLRHIEIEVDPVERAKSLLESDFEVEITNTNGKITFQASKDTIPTIVKQLVANDIAVYQINVSRPTLEDKFLDLIGENIIE